MERFARVVQGVHQMGSLEHALMLLTSPERGALVVHVPQDGTAWYGIEQDQDAVAELGDLALGIATNDEADTTEIARSLEPDSPEKSPEALMSGLLLMLAEANECEAAALLGRDASQAPAWLAARYEPGRVHYMEAPPDTFTLELVRLHELAVETVDSSMPKPSLRLAEAGSYSTLNLPPELGGSIDERRQAFRRKFGRDPGPEDPFFFDPDADTPQPLPQQKVRDIEARLAEHGFNEEEYLKGLAELEEAGLLRRGGRKIGRNDPCWCGSGNKYKNCHGA